MQSSIPENNVSMQPGVVFVVRLSAIGDTIIALNTIAALISRGFQVVFCTRKENIAVAELLVDLKHKLIWDENTCVNWHEIQPLLQSNAPITILDLQCTSRSFKVVSFLEKNIYNKQISIYKVAKKSFDRIWLVIKSEFALNQNAVKPLNYANIISISTLHKELLAKIWPDIFNEFKLISLNLNKYKAEHLMSLYKEKYIVLNLGASGQIKTWPTEYYSVLVQMLLSKTSRNIVLTGGKSDLSIAETIISKIADSRIISFVGMAALADSLMILAHAEHIVTADTFASHAAELFRVPCSIIFGPTSPAFGFAPVYQEGIIMYANLKCSPCTRHGKRTCRFKNQKCMRDITPIDVLHTLNIES